MANIRSFSIPALAGLSSCITLQEDEILHCQKGLVFPRDAFNVGKYASLGESYASGPSAGDKYDDSKRRRYKQAFGPQISANPRLLGPKPIEFHFIACS